MNVGAPAAVEIPLMLYGIVRHGLDRATALRYTMEITSSLMGEMVPSSETLMDLFDAAVAIGAPSS